MKELQAKAYQYICECNYINAIKIYRQLIEFDDNNVNNYFYLGMAQLLADDSNFEKTWSDATTQIENGQISRSHKKLGNLLEYEAIRLADVGNSKDALILRFKIFDIYPNNLSNIISIIKLKINLGSFTSKVLSDLKINSILHSDQLIQLDEDVLLDFLENIISYMILDLEVFNFIENLCRIHIQYIDSIVKRFIKISSHLKESLSLDTAINIFEIANRLAPDNLEVLMYLVDFYQIDNPTKSIDIAKKLYQTSSNKRNIDKVLACQWSIKALIQRYEYWEEVKQISQEHDYYLQKLIAESPTSLSIKEASFYLLASGFYPLYFSDNPKFDHTLRGQVRKFANNRIYTEASTHINRYAKSNLLKKKTYKNRLLRIGYISCFMNRHSIGYLSRWLLKYHDRNRIEIYGYFGSNRHDDPLQIWFKQQFDKVYDNVDANYISLANQIQKDGIDILIDLDSITSSYSLGALALKPAPIQITWLGWDASGQDSIDYFMADPYVLPENADEYYTEKIWRLPQTYIAVDGFESSTPTVRRDTLNIPSDAVIYFSAQASMKRHPDTIRLQMQIVKSVPNSYLVLKSMGDQESLQEFFYQMAEAEGVEKERLRFLPITNSEAEHRANLIIADIVLDTYPYNGATHTLETLWMGIPMVTRVGEQFAARNSYTMMINAGITEGIAWTDEEYVEWGIRLGTDINLRNQVILKLRQGKQTAPLWNSRQFTRDMESAYEQMWQIWLDSEDPDIEIDPVADRDLFIAEAELRNQDAIRLAQKGKLDSAIACWQAAISLHPEYIDANYNMGIAQVEAGNLEDAINSFQTTIELDPSHANALYNLGLALSRENKLDEAIAAYDRAFELNPEDVDIPLALGSAFFKQGEWEWAINAYQSALEINPESVMALGGLGATLTEYGEIEEAINCLQSAIAIEPNDARIYCNLGYAFARVNRTEDAAFCYQKALQLNPTSGNTYWNFNNDILANADSNLYFNLPLRRQLADQFLESCYKTDKIRSLVNFCSNYAHSGLGDIAKLKIADLENTVLENSQLSDIEIQVLYNNLLFILSSLRDDRQLNFNLYRLVGNLYRDRIIQPKITSESRHLCFREVKQTLKIGFISPHFARHPVGWCSFDVIRELSKITPHIYLYATGNIKPDEKTRGFEQIAEKYYWHDSLELQGKVSSYDNRLYQLASDIEQDQLDVIIDLDSVTIPINTHILCRNLAPVCLSWLGFDAPFVSSENYWLGDRFTHPEGVDKYYLEKILRLPDAHMAVSGFESIELDRDIEREKLGIASNQVAYLYAAPARKFNRDSARACISILRQVPNSVLLHKGNGDHEVLRNIYNEICDEIGVSSERVIFLPSYKTEEEHRGIYAIADVFLDSYPYNGGSHNLEVLWFNLPVVTLVGEQSFARMGYSFLQALGIDAGIAHNWEEYITWAVRYGLEPEFRNSIKQKLIDSKNPTNLAPLWNPQKLAQDMYNLLQSLF